MMLRKHLPVSALLVFAFCAAPPRVNGQVSPNNRLSTSTTLAITSSGAAVTTVPAGSVVTLTATVQQGSLPVTPGQINFCDSSPPHCTDIHLLGTAQLTSNGTAQLKFRPGLGSHSYKAVFLGTNLGGPSSSDASQLVVTGKYPSNTSIVTSLVQSAVGEDYTLNATVTGVGPAPPTGAVSFIDTSNGNLQLANGDLEGGFQVLSWLYYPSQQIEGNWYGAGQTLAAADFNGDGIADLAVLTQGGSNLGPGAVTVMVGNGDGTFTVTPNSLATGDGPIDIAVADFNGDGNADLAVLNWIDETITILLGKGDGTFVAPPRNIAAGYTPSAIAVADFNGDGNTDLAVLNIGYNSVMILLGNGDGTFTASPTSTTTSLSPQGIATADFNGDGNADLAVLNQDGSVSILLGSGDGTFTAAPTIAATAINPAGIATADFNGDGNADLAVLSQDGKVSILLGNGDGTFVVGHTAHVWSPFPISMAVGDFNADGNVDLAVICAGSGAFAILLGNGDGTFTFGDPTESIEPNSFLESLAAADFNGDGVSDLAVQGTSPSAFVSVQLAQTQTAGAAASGISVWGAGAHLVDAEYSGDANYNPGVSDTTPLYATHAAPPTFNLPTGYYAAPISISIADTTSGATIHFTIDGSTPTASSPIYTGPIILNATTAVMAIAQAPGYGVSSVARATYTIVPYSDTLSVTSMPPVSVAAQLVTFTATVIHTSVVNVAPTGTITFTATPTSQSGSNPLNGCSAVPVTPNPNGTASASCMVQVPASFSGIFTVSSTYTGDSTFATSTGSITQTIQNFSLAWNVTATGSATPLNRVILTKGYSTFTNGSQNTIDPLGPASVTLVSTPSYGFSDPLTATCTVANASSGAIVGDPSCLSISNAFSGNSGPLAFTLSASPTAFIGAYIVTVTAVDSTTQALSQSTPPLLLYVVSEAGTLNLTPGASGSESVTFNTATLPPPATAPTTLSNFECGTIVNYGNGTLIPSNVASSEVTCTGPTTTVSGLQTAVPITIKLLVPTAQASLWSPRSNTVYAAAFLGLPLLALMSWVGRKDSPRRNFFRFIVLILLIVGISYVSSCGGSFTRPAAPSSSGLPSGSYLVQVVVTDQNGAGPYYAVVPLIVSADLN